MDVCVCVCSRSARQLESQSDVHTFKWAGNDAGKSCNCSVWVWKQSRTGVKKTLTGWLVDYHPELSLCKGFTNNLLIKHSVNTDQLHKECNLKIGATGIWSFGHPSIHPSAHPPTRPLSWIYFPSCMTFWISDEVLQLLMLQHPASLNTSWNLR